MIAYSWNIWIYYYGNYNLDLIFSSCLLLWSLILFFFPSLRAVYAPSCQFATDSSMGFVWWRLKCFDFVLCEKNVAVLLRLGLTSYLCCLLLDSFLTTKRHFFDVKPSYILIFSIFQSVYLEAKNCICKIDSYPGWIFSRILKSSFDALQFLARLEKHAWVCKFHQFLKMC